MFRLSDGEEIMTLALFVLILNRSVTNRRTDGRTDGHLYSGYTSACIARYANALVKMRPASGASGCLVYGLEFGLGSELCIGLRWSTSDNLPPDTTSTCTVHNCTPHPRLRFDLIDRCARYKFLPREAIRVVRYCQGKLSVCLSVCDVEVSWSYRFEFLENNFTAD